MRLWAWRRRFCVVHHVHSALSKRAGQRQTMMGVRLLEGRLDFGSIVHAGCRAAASMACLESAAIVSVASAATLNKRLWIAVLFW
jgi:hypothetical protein